MNAIAGQGEVALWRAVIQQALTDAMPRARVHGGRPVLSAQRRIAMGDARRWFAEAGRDFWTVCESALLEAMAVQAAARKAIAAFDLKLSLASSVCNSHESDTTKIASMPTIASYIHSYATEQKTLSH
ncbi:MAG: hypothetical protein H7840_12610 [Alphaproteobacteria bacterium]